jgi:hypothetical protein
MVAGAEVFRKVESVTWRMKMKPEKMKENGKVRGQEQEWREKDVGGVEGNANE